MKVNLHPFQTLFKVGKHNSHMMITMIVNKRIDRMLTNVVAANSKQLQVIGSDDVCVEPGRAGVGWVLCVCGG